MFSRTRIDFIFSYVFNSFVVLLIVCDAILAGFQANDRGLSRDGLWVGNCIITAAMMVEFALKLKSFGCLFQCDIWNIMDFCGFLVLAFDTTERLVYGLANNSLWLRCFSLVRIGRLSKCLTSIRDNRPPILTYFLRNTRPLLGFTVYTLAYLCLLGIIGGLVLSSDVVPRLSLLSSSPGGSWARCKNYIGDVYVSMFTCIQAVTLDTWFAEVERPLMRSDRWVASFVLFVIVLGGSIVYSSLLVGAFVNQAQNTSLDLSEAVKKANESVLAEARFGLHRSLVAALGSREVSLEDLISSINNNEGITSTLETLDISSDDISSVWRTIDSTGSDFLPVEKLRFVWERIHGLGRGRDVLELQSSLSHARSKSQSVKQDMIKLGNGIKQLDETLAKITTFLSRNEGSIM